MRPFSSPALRPALRIAARDALRARGRSMLVLVMVALPVLAVTAADIVIHTEDVSGRESVDRRLGTVAQARITATSTTKVEQALDPDSVVSYLGQARTPATLAQVTRLLGPGTTALEYDEGSTRVTTRQGVADISATEVDLRSPLAAGLTRLTAGRMPRTAEEVVVNVALADRGIAVGDRLTLPDGPGPTVVGLAESTTLRDSPAAYGPAGSLDLTPDDPSVVTWLVDGPPVTWSQVRALNGIGVYALSRQVLLDPPPASQVPASVRSTGGSTDAATVAVAVLVVVMVLLEVVLLAGPAFAVGARRQARTLALLAASGGTPRQARLVVLAGGLVLGGAAAVLGVVLGIGAGALALPLLQRFSGTWFGPFQVPWLQLLGIAGFGLVSALLAAVVPAWIASRQDIVAVLAGRRGDRPPSVRSPILGVLLLAAGVAGSWYGARSVGDGAFVIAVAALVSVLGTILVVPVVVAALARAAARAPLPLRYAVRDAARHRTRTVPAIAAVAATVAGVVALGIGNASDAAQSRGQYSPQLAMGDAAVQSYGTQPPDWGRLRQAVQSRVPSAAVTGVSGVPRSSSADGSSLDVSFRAPGRSFLSQAYNTSLGSDVLVAADRLPPGLAEVPTADRAPAAAVLRRGGAVVLTSEAVDATSVRMRVVTYDAQGNTVGRARTTVVPAYFLRWPGLTAPASAVISPAAARAVAAPVATVGLFLSGPTLSSSREQDLQEAITAITPDAHLYVERGYREDDANRIALLILGALGAVLMLGGTLTATFLALSDARPDLATLSAVGAAPRTRRAVAAAYALVVGVVGALLGAAVGFVPGIAVSFPLTSTTWTSDLGGPTHYLAIPWTMIVTLVVALPLLTALIVGLTARSRLPLVARLD